MRAYKRTNLKSNPKFAKHLFITLKSVSYVNSVIKMPGLLKIISPTLNIHRHVGKCKFNWFGEGIQYPGFKYYPRNPDFKDPPYEPTKLFRVERIKPMKGVPYWERNILEEFKLGGKKNCFAVVKNIPENNHRLWKVKHLIEIKPITFPDGFPSETDRTVLMENGELRIIKKLEPLEEKLELTEKFQNDDKKLDPDTLRRDSRLKWLSGWDVVY